MMMQLEGTAPLDLRLQTLLDLDHMHQCAPEGCTCRPQACWPSCEKQAGLPACHTCRIKEQAQKVLLVHCTLRAVTARAPWTCLSPV